MDAPCVTYLHWASAHHCPISFSVCCVASYKGWEQVTPSVSLLCPLQQPITRSFTFTNPPSRLGAKHGQAKALFRGRGRCLRAGGGRVVHPGQAGRVPQGPGPSASALRAHDRGSRGPQGSRVPQAAGRSARRMPGSAEPDWHVFPWHGWAGCKSRAPRAQAGAGPGRGLTRRPQARVSAASWGRRLAAGPRPRAARRGRVRTTTPSAPRRGPPAAAEETKAAAPGADFTFRPQHERQRGGRRRRLFRGGHQPHPQTLRYPRRAPVLPGPGSRAAACGAPGGAGRPERERGVVVGAARGAQRARGGGREGERCPRPGTGAAAPGFPAPGASPAAACPGNGPWRITPLREKPVTCERESWLGPALSSASTAARSTRCGSGPL